MKPRKMKSAMVRNETEAAPKLSTQFTKLTLNLLPAKTRIETLEDRSHTVVPMVMLVPGIHPGSSGPLLYNEDELSKTPQIWNHKPVVVYHPEGLDGAGISACDPVVVNTRKIGMIMNTKWEPKTKRLTAEAWIEMPRAEKVDKRVADAITKNEMMELSTGLFVDLEDTPGELDGNTYNGIVRNIRADHLAVLPDKIGACSIDKGAGFLRNEERSQTVNPEKKKGLGEIASQLRSMGLQNFAARLTSNEMSFSNIRDTLSALIRQKLNPAKSDSGPWAWVEDVYSNFFIYETGGKLFRLGYSASDSGVSLSEENPVEVNRVTEYRTVAGAKFVGNCDQQQQVDNDMTKANKIAAILAVANCGWEQKALEGLNDTQIDGIHKGLVGNTTQTPPATPTPGTVQNTTQTQAQQPQTVTTNANVEKKEVTVEEYISQAPGHMKDVLRNMDSAYKKEVSELVAVITANKANTFSKETLEGMTVENLRGLAALAKTPAAAPQGGGYGANFTGQVPATGLTGNEDKFEQPALVPPVMNFRKEAATK